MTDISVIILTGKEELHIGRCLEKLAPLEPQQIIVVESQKGDRTHEIALAHGATCVWHDWPGLQSTQFNWALDVVEGKSRVEGLEFRVDGGWILRLDADEYIDESGIEWLRGNLDSVPSDVDALEFTLERKFMGGVIRHGTNGIKMVRMFRAGRGRYAETKMDERIVFEGKKLEVPVVFWDDNLNSLECWKEKHRGYAKREAEQAILGGSQDPRKASYYKLPRYLRAFLYFGVRYILKRGFLDGLAGWRWHFWQGLWYRCLVDYEIGTLKRASARD